MQWLNIWEHWARDFNFLSFFYHFTDRGCVHFYRFFYLKKKQVWCISSTLLLHLHNIICRNKWWSLRMQVNFTAYRCQQWQWLVKHYALLYSCMIDLLHSNYSPRPLTTHVGLDHSHPVGGEGSRLVRADGRGVTHGLACVQVTHQVVVIHHFLKIIVHF